MQRISIRNHNSIEELKEAARKTRDSAERQRINAIVKIKEGKSGLQIAEMLLVSRKAIGNWISSYNANGLKGLKTQKTGRKEGNHKWEAEIFNELAKEIDNTEQYWSVPIMNQWIQENYQQDIPHTTILYHLRKLGYSYTSARPHPYKGNPLLQEEFKKKVSKRWSKS